MRTLKAPQGPHLQPHGGSRAASHSILPAAKHCPQGNAAVESDLDASLVALSWLFFRKTRI